MAVSQVGRVLDEGRQQSGTVFLVVQCQVVDAQAEIIEFGLEFFADLRGRAELLLVALEQLGIAPRLIELIVSIFLASAGLAFALAFGFGCQDLAKKFLSDTVEKFKSKK